MEEDELREALRGTMTASPPPPPMSASVALKAARRARVRRYAGWTCAGTAAALAVVAVAASVLSGGSGQALTPGTPPTPMSSLRVGPNPSVGETGNEQAWPTGPDGKPQEDRTARAGTRYDQGVRLLSELVAAVPAGYTAPSDPSPPDPNGPPGLRYHQAQFADRVNGIELWEYMATAAVAQGDRTGMVLAEVRTQGNNLPTQPCELAKQLWGMGGNCEVVTVGTAQVGVATKPAGGDQQFDQWAAYRRADGVVVFLAQSLRFDDARPALAALPFSAMQLATLAIDDRFHVT